MAVPVIEFGHFRYPVNKGAVVNKKLVLGLSLLITMNMHGMDAQKGVVALEGLLGVQRNLLEVYQQQLVQQQLNLEEAKAQTALQRRQAEEQAKQTANLNAILGILAEGNVRLVTALEAINTQCAGLASVMGKFQADSVRATLALEALVDGQKNQTVTQSDQVRTLQALVALETRIVDGEITVLHIRIKELEAKLAQKSSKRRSLRRNPTAGRSAAAQFTQASELSLHLLNQLPSVASLESALSSSDLSVHSSNVSDDGKTDGTDDDEA